jgi:hypothetical protein
MVQRLSKQNIIDQLVKNNVILQQKSADLLQNMNTLNKNMTNLVNIFQKAAENIDRGDEKEPLTFKLQQLLDQNRQLARGLLLLEQYIKQRTPQPTKNEF